MEKLARLLTIAGSAPGGSAGIQADIKTFQELNTYGMSVITAFVGRHPKSDKNVRMQTVETIEAQFYTSMKQIGVDAMKTGMLFSKDIIEAVVNLIIEHDIETIVVDPVMIGKLDSKLLKDDAISVLKEKLIPMANMVTPNMPEASVLLDGRSVETVDDMITAAKDIHDLGVEYVLVKGGRLDGPAVDVLYNGEKWITYTAPRIDTVNTSGAGCSYSAAITALLGRGFSARDAVKKAKQYVTTAIEHGFSYNDMVGPTHHAAERLYGAVDNIIVEEI